MREAQAVNLRISKQISGNAVRRGDAPSQGRGEYEWCDVSGADPAQDVLLNRRIIHTLPGGVSLDTGCILGWDEGQKKNRVRNAEDFKGVRHNYPPYHVAVALLLPLPTRTEQNWGGGLPILRTEQYSIVDIFCGGIVLPDAALAVIAAEQIRIQNQYGVDDILCARRMEDVERLWSQKGNLPSDLATLVQEHENLVRAGGSITGTGNGLVQRIQSVTAEQSTDFPELQGASAVSDPLLTLLEMAGLTASHPEIPIAEIPADQTEIRRREIRRMRLTVSRGPQAAKFRRAVCQAYNFTCLICGVRLPQAVPGGNPGVDAAHILPYSEYDLEEAANGVCLCKLHHWAFDEGLIEIRHGAAGYSVAIPDEAIPIAEESGIDLSFLRVHVGPVHGGRLPRTLYSHPKPEYLARLHEIFYPPD